MNSLGGEGVQEMLNFTATAKGQTLLPNSKRDTLEVMAGLMRRKTKGAIRDGKAQKQGQRKEGGKRLCRIASF